MRYPKLSKVVRAEVILLLIWVSLLLLQGLGSRSIFINFQLATIAFSLFYLFGSTTLVRIEKDKEFILSILAGIALSTSLITIPYKIHLRNWPILDVLPYINYAFIGCLLIVLAWNRIKNVKEVFRLAPLLFRACVLVIPIVFISFKQQSSLVRSVLIYLNSHDSEMVSNLRMIDFFKESKNYSSVGKHDEAISLAKLAQKEGYHWLRINEEQGIETKKDELYKIQATFTGLYDAYSAKAAFMSESGQYHQAVKYQKLADSVLNYYPPMHRGYIKSERATSKNELAFYYDKSGKVDSAIYYYTKAIEFHMDSIQTLNRDLAVYCDNLVSSYKKEKFWKNAYQLSKYQLQVLNSFDSLRKEKVLYRSVYLNLPHLALLNDELSEAREHLTEAKRIAGLDNTVKLNLFNSMFQLRVDSLSQAQRYAEKALKIAYQQNDLPKTFKIVTYALLFESLFRKADFNDAKPHLEKILELLDSGQNDYLETLNLYIINKAKFEYYTGDYKNGLKTLSELRPDFDRYLQKNVEDRLELLVLRGTLENELGSKKNAQRTLDICMDLAIKNDWILSRGSGSFMNQLAHLNYATGDNEVADTLFSNVLELNKALDYQSPLDIASALNGLALLAVDRKQYQKAEKLFEESLLNYQKVFDSSHPSIGIVLMNKSELKLLQNSPNKALLLVDQVSPHFEVYTNQDHPIYGDLNLLKAKVALKTGNKTLATNAVNSALAIYRIHFEESHSKISTAKVLLESLNRIKPIIL